MSINLNTNPYYDDYSEDKKFHRILFRPGYAVQARELTQMQTILQKQIERHGSHVFKQGAMVIPGQSSINNQADYVKVTLATGIDALELEGVTLIGATSGVSALVTKAFAASGSDPATLYIRYQNSGTDSETKVFAESEILQNTSVVAVATVAATTATGKGTLASIERGVYYVNGFFCLVEAQTIAVAKYDQKPNARIGLRLTESIVAPEDDQSLLDNAVSSPNFAAPGAHRLAFDLTLEAIDTSSVLDENFIELSLVEGGEVKKEIRSTEYAVLEETLARRTFDESGDYTVRNFEIDVREHRNNDRGQWTTSTSYLIGDVVVNGGVTYVAKKTAVSGGVAPVHTSGTAYDGAGSTGVQWEWDDTPVYNRGIYTPEQGGDESKLAIGLEPGKAYVKGYEIEKIATEFVDVPKSRTSAIQNNQVIRATVGNYILVTNIYGLVDINNFEQVELHSRLTAVAGTSPAAQIGTARVRNVELHSTGIYKLFLFDVKLNAGIDFNRQVKAVVATNFTADVQPNLTQITGSVTASGTAVTGTGTSFQTDLVVGDWVRIGSTTVRVDAIGSQNAFTASASVTATGSTIFRLSTEVLEPENVGLVFPIGQFAVKAVTDTTYTVPELYSGTTNASGIISFTATSGVFASAADSDNYLVVRSTGAAIPAAAVTPTGNTVSISTGANNTAVKVIAAVTKTGATVRKTKTLQSTTLTLTGAGNQSVVQSSSISLGKSDVFRVISIKMAESGDWTSPGAYTIDISDRFDLDDGQRSTHYDLGRLNRKASFTAPIRPIQIVFEYFDHSGGVGDYFTVESYPSTVAYKDIPYFSQFALRDSFDFRPRVDDTGANYTGTGASAARLPKRGNDIISDIEYYLARKTAIAIDNKGRFFGVDSAPSLTPQDPAIPENGMRLYSLTLEPYTFGTEPESVAVTKIDNRRYTMRDIGALEKRIGNLEYYTSLSLLEQQTESLDVYDATGETRFKNGFIVDDFTGHTTGDAMSADYACAIDAERGELRPLFTMDNVNMIEKNAAASRAASNYQMYGDVITLPVTQHVPFIKQPYGSRVENVNPFAISKFIGSVELNPSTDDWFDINRAPDIVNQVEGNFNTMTILARTIQTTWNSWQTQWTGAPVVTSRSTFEFNRAGRRIRRTTEALATTSGETRTAVRAVVVPRIDTEVVSERVLSTVLIPYIRQRNVLIRVQGLKPNTRFYPFFDDVDVSDYCLGASKVVYTPSAGVFDDNTNVGNLATVDARRINGDSQVCLNKGDIITASGGGTAVVVGKEYNPQTLQYSLFVVNIKGSLTGTITGSISGATGTIVSVITPSNLTTNFNGSIQLLFNIPNTEALRFRIGTREFKLVDTNEALGAFTSRGRAPYRAQGVLETRQRTVNAVRNAEIAEETIVESRTVVSNSTRFTETDIGAAPPPPPAPWFDPLAQTFLVDNNGGAFLTKVDVYFSSKDASLPVTLEIREVVNGYPGKAVLPFSRVTLTPDQVNVSTNFVLVDGVQTPTFDTPTTFSFRSPVYVQNNTEYCVVLLSDSTNYNVWISQMGEQVPGTTRTISEQPYMGVLFKSQNASTWTANQEQDLMFTLYRAEFAVNTVANIEFVNDVLPLQSLEVNPFETRSGTNKVRVYQEAHGMPVGSSVTISGVTANVNGIAFAQFNATHIISDVDYDSYVITVASNATSTGYAGGSTVKATRNLMFNLIQPQVQVQSFSDTSVSFGIKTTTGKSVDGSETAYVVDTGFTPVVANENNQFDVVKLVASEVNETALMSGAKSLTMSVQMSTLNSSISPVLDTHRTGAIVVSNMINMPVETTSNVSTLDDNAILSANTTIAFDSVTKRISSTNALLATVAVGKYITVSGAANGANNGTFLVTKVEAGATNYVTVNNSAMVTAATGTAITIVQRETFVDEIAPFGSSSIAKYATRDVKLANASNMLNIRFAAAIPAGATIEVYYKTRPVGATTDLNTVPYTLAQPTNSLVVDPVGFEQFRDVECSIESIAAFDVVKVKLVMKSNNMAAVPRAKDLRIIALA